jgi:hypothetical protein
VKRFDAAYPAGAPAAIKIAQTSGSKRTYTSLYTPMAVASWTSLIPVLEQSGLLARKNGAYLIVQIGKLVKMMQKDTSWNEMPGNTASLSSAPFAPSHWM